MGRKPVHPRAWLHPTVSRRQAGGTAAPMSTQAAPRRASSDELLALWRQYRTSGDARLRDRIILSLAPMVKFIVYRKIRSVPAHVEAEDFISVGLEGLIQSIDQIGRAHV